MSKFYCIAKTKLQISKQTIDKILNLEPIDFSSTSSLARQPIYRQLYLLVRKYKTINDTITLTDHLTGESLLVTKELFTALRDRREKLVKFWNITDIQFREQEIPTPLQDEVKSFLPEKLQLLNPCVVVQSKFENFGTVPPHKDHYRTASLFYLLQGNDEETVWWEKTEEFKEYSFYKHADITKIKKIHSEYIQEKIWYVFDNATYHSVHTDPTRKIIRRTALCVEFNNISAADLYAIMHDYEK